MEKEIEFENATPGEEEAKFSLMMESNYTNLDLKSTPFHLKIS